MEVLNHDIKAMHSRINRYIEECIKAVSSSGSLLNEFDKARIKSYLSSLRFMHDFVVGQPAQDLPETHPRPYALRQNPVVPELESEMMNDIIGLFEVMRDELVNSQSARNASGLISFDSVRFQAHLARIEVYLAEYVDKATPLDLPESSPRAVVSGEGRKGI